MENGSHSHYWVESKFVVDDPPNSHAYGLDFKGLGADSEETLKDFHGRQRKKYQEALKQHQETGGRVHFSMLRNDGRACSIHLWANAKELEGMDRAAMAEFLRAKIEVHLEDELTSPHGVQFPDGVLSFKLCSSLDIDKCDGNKDLLPI